MNIGRILFSEEFESWIIVEFDLIEIKEKLSYNNAKGIMINELKGSDNMPLISQFYGILISMYKEDGGRHKVPHFHAYYGDFECVYGLYGELIAGELPIKQKKMVEAWAAIHEEELVAEWKSIMELGQHFKIDGLK